MPPKGWRKSQPEPEATPKDYPNATPPDTVHAQVRAVWAQAEATVAAEKRRDAADASLLKVARKIARWNPAAALPEFRGPLTADIQALKAALAEYDAARSET